MTLAVALFGLFLAALGAAGIVSPERLLGLVTRAQTQLGLRWIAAFRLAIGGALLLAAPGSRSPVALQVFGALAIASGLATPFFGIRRFEAMLGWWRRRGPWFVRLWSAAVLLLGLALLWTVLPEGGGTPGGR